MHWRCKNVLPTKSARLRAPYEVTAAGFERKNRPDSFSALCRCIAFAAAMQHFAAAVQPSATLSNQAPIAHVYVLVALTLYASWRDSDQSSPLGPPAPVAIRSIPPLQRDPLGASAQHDAAGPFPIRIWFVSADLSESAFTPWQSADSSILILGLKAGGTYTMRVQSSFDIQPIDGPVSEYQTPSLPAALEQVRIQLEGTFSGGYSMTPIGALDGHGYLIIFDSLGTIRWYRDFGTQVVFATTQQEDGRITAFVGQSDGFNMSSGVYVEVTSTGDSVRAVTAVGSAYTDPHELLESFDRQGNRRAEYLFGYDFQELSPTPCCQRLRPKSRPLFDRRTRGKRHRPVFDAEVLRARVESGEAAIRDCRV